MNVNLIRFKKNGSPKIFPLPNGTTVIGRQRGCDLRVPVMSVSKRHCRVSLNNGVLKVRDLGSRNGTYLNDNRLSDEETEVQAGSFLRIGPVTFLFQIDGNPEKLIPPKPQVQKAQKAEPPKQDISADESTTVQQPMVTEDVAEEQSVGLSSLAELEDLEKLDSAEEN